MQEAGREQKFISIDNAIRALSKTVDGVGSLITEMQEGPSDKPPEEIKSIPNPPFQTVYDGAPERIMEITDRLRKLTGEIRSRLF